MGNLVTSGKSTLWDLIVLGVGKWIGNITGGWVSWHSGSKVKKGGMRQKGGQAGARENMQDEEEWVG